MKHLPAELWAQIVLRISSSDWNNLRLTQKWICGIVTPIRFREITFDISEEGIQRLNRLSLAAHLARHVRICNSRAAPCLRKFDNIQDWKDYIDLDDSHDGDVMSTAEWEGLSTNEITAMFTDYNSERVVAKQRVRRLQSCLHKTLRNFPMLTKFVHRHNPFEELPFRKHWRRLHFARRVNGILEEHSGNSNDEDIERVQLVSAWQALSQAVPDLKMLRTMTWHVRKDAFENAASSGSARAEKKRFGHLGHVFERMIQLDCFLYDCDGDGWYPDMGLIALGNLLCYARNVKRLHLRLGNVRNGQFEPPVDRPDDFEGTRGLLNHLAKRQPWPQIRTLELSLGVEVSSLLEFLNSIAASLEHLVLAGVALIPAQVPKDKKVVHNESESTAWELILPVIVGMLPKLKKLETTHLFHYPNGKLQTHDPPKREPAAEFLTTDTKSGQLQYFD